MDRHARMASAAARRERRRVNRPHDALVGEIFLAAIERPRSRRAPFLDERCGDDQALREEVESLLRHHSETTITEQPVDKLLAAARGRTGRPTGPSRRLAWNAKAGRRRIAAALLLITAAVAFIGVAVDLQARRQLTEVTGARLTEVHNANVAALAAWLRDQQAMMRDWAAMPSVRAPILELIEHARGRDVAGAEIFDHPANTELSAALAPLLARPGILGVNAMSREGLMISRGPGDSGIEGARRMSAQGGRYVASVFLGDVIATPPFTSPGLISTPNATPAPAVPSTAGNADREPPPTRAASARLVVAAPIRGDDGTVVAALGARIASVTPMTQALQTARLAESGHTYAFNEDGLIVTEVGDLAELTALGLIPSVEGVNAAFNLEVRDPGGDLAAGFPPPSTERPLTHMAVQATTGGSGIDLDGYRDFTGRYVVGTSTWLPEFHLGVATEMPYGQAYGALRTIRLGFGVMVALLLGVSAYGVLSTVSVRDLSRRAVDKRRLGRYRLQEPIGEGGMSRVYRATHSMLRRPVAIKVLKPGMDGDDAMARFEREVHVVAGLNHPNIIQVFDYGRTDTGSLFYVMEYVPGITLSELVHVNGPQRPPRAIAILQQVAGSLREAHAAGIVHRDVKPANVMICERTDGADTVKVLDFGLARGVASTAQITRENLLGGTPAYIAPERIRTPDAVDVRSDIYSFGAMAFHLLSGREVVEGDTPEEVLLQSLNRGEVDVAGSLPDGTPAELTRLIAQCLLRDIAARPQSMDEIIAFLDGLAAAYPWRGDDARAWWTAWTSMSDPTSSKERTAAS